jgi:uncharacterized membrane protein|tara:strand:+ start:3785 stop:4120 length:336 start_codon:yes stop_codon:yes gene_type:complete
MTTENNTGKKAAITAYFTVFGTIIAFFLNFDIKNKFAYFHIRQALGLFSTFFLISFFIGYFDSLMISGAFYLFFIILWFYGITSAFNNSTTPVPLLGEYYQKLFKMIGEDS